MGPVWCPSWCLSPKLLPLTLGAWKPALGAASHHSRLSSITPGNSSGTHLQADNGGSNPPGDTTFALSGFPFHQLPPVPVPPRFSFPTNPPIDQSSCPALCLFPDFPGVPRFRLPESRLSASPTPHRHLGSRLQTLAGFPLTRNGGFDSLPRTDRRGEGPLAYHLPNRPLWVRL